MRLISLSTLAALAACPVAADELDTQAVALFEAAFSDDICPLYFDDPAAPERYDITRGEGEGTLTVFAFTCDFGAYNRVDAFVIQTNLDGLHVASFAQPALDLTYTDENNTMESELAHLGIAGYETTATLINAAVDERTGQIVTQEKWRGVGDAMSAGTWDLTLQGYVLRDYEVDASYDGELNPVSLLKNGQPVD
ncbi:hypothetical protein EKE94_07095 [Mesobaculum littorinae]|uniref:Uncharacterized protein n=1 Tax=Mesobaculum littorinae TaxID=2486419 RepID=A0A438AJ10_9RHOB|nr:DUF1176 domain-containing protein [Mesobaculum littorinae]RVV98668.1 hypothetical protein EKE94_07095 [Mesobaculum littorinae]